MHRPYNPSFIGFNIICFSFYNHTFATNETPIIDATRVSMLVQEALKDENWVQAMHEGMSASEKNQTQKIVDNQMIERQQDSDEFYNVKYKSNSTLDHVRYIVFYVNQGNSSFKHFYGFS